MNRREWAIARRVLWPKGCFERGHPIYWVGPYLICRKLECKTLVVGVNK